MSSYKKIVKKDKSLLITPLYDSFLLKERTCTTGIKLMINDKYIELDKRELRCIIFYLTSMLWVKIIGFAQE